MKNTNELKTEISEIIKIIGLLNAKNVERLCNKIDISMEDLYYFFRISFYNNIEINANNQAISERVVKKLIQGMKDITNEVANDITTCNKEKELYNLYEHYKKYGLSPYDVKKIAKILNREEISKMVDNYIETHPNIFTTISSDKISGMLRRTSLYQLNFYLENVKVSYDKRTLTRALKTLEEENIPIYKGTLFEVLKLEKERTVSEKSNKILKKSYKISKKVWLA